MVTYTEGTMCGLQSWKSLSLSEDHLSQNYDTASQALLTIKTAAGTVGSCQSYVVQL